MKLITIATMHTITIYLLLTAATFGLPSRAAAQPPGMAGLQIGSTFEDILSVDMELLVHNDFAYKFETPNGNEFSVTHENGKVVYMENHWSGDTRGSDPLYTGFLFGQTSLEEIRDLFGSNGFTFGYLTAVPADDGVLLFNCYEMEGHDSNVLVLVTRVRAEEGINEHNMDSKAKLVGVILGEEAYLESIWGGRMEGTEQYKPVSIK